MNSFYVYALKNPRVKPAKPFYIGKGIGTRAWEHEIQKNLDNCMKKVVQILDKKT